MVLYPEVQRKARAEIDMVIGPNRLPDHNDRESLPYINALVKETLRWQPVTPLGMHYYQSQHVINLKIEN
jgi:cytochrome P450